MAESARYRVLSLDGGGIRGIMTAVWLNRLEKKLGGKLADHFDLVAGTSTGAILACAVSAGISTTKIIDLYQKRGQIVFPSEVKRWASRAWRVLSEGPSGPKYDGVGLTAELKKIFGKRTFGGLRIKPTLVTTYNTLGREALVFKSTNAQHSKLPVWELCKASSSAPTFFPGHVLKVGRRNVPLIDGGVVANNPTACAIAEALNQKTADRKRVSVDSLVVASFGTGTVTRPIEIEDTQEWGALEWAIPVINVLFDGAGDATDYISRRLVDESRYFRFQTELTVALDDMDNATPENVNNLLIEAARHMDSEGGADKVEKLAEAIK